MNQIEQYLASAKAELDRNGFKHICIFSANNNNTDQVEIHKYLTTIGSATSEEPIQKYFQDHPSLVIGETGGQCRWVIPQKRLGSELVPDFITARLDSRGVKWTLVELQSPMSSPYNSKGHLSAQLNEGVSQINEWRRWLEDNLDYARRERAKNGLGLKDISPRCDGLILIGREDDRDEQTRARLKQLALLESIDVRSYDWLAREAEKQIRFRLINEPEECRCY